MPLTAPDSLTKLFQHFFLIISLLSGFIVKHLSNSLSSWDNIIVASSHCLLSKAFIHQITLYLIFITSPFNLSETHSSNLNCDDCMTKVYTKL